MPVRQVKKMYGRARAEVGLPANLPARRNDPGDAPMAKGAVGKAKQSLESRADRLGKAIRDAGG